MRNQMLSAVDEVAFGAALKQAEMAVVNTLDENSDPADYDAYQTARYEALAGAIIGYLINNSVLWVACADAIIDEIQTYAVITPLSVSNTAMGTPPHTHVPAATVQAQGKIE